MHLFLIDGIGPFFVGCEPRRINWSKAPFAELEQDGGPNLDRFDQIAADFDRLCTRAKALGYTAVTLDDVAHVADHPAYSPPVRQMIQRFRARYQPLFRHLAQHQLDGYLTMDVLSLTPCLEAWINDDFERSLRFLEEQLEQLFRTTPAVKGAVVRIGECDGHDVRGRFRSRLHLTTAERTRRFLQHLLPVFARHQRTLIFRTWTVGAHPIGDLCWNRDTFLTVFDDLDHESLVISMKYGESDFFRHQAPCKHFFRSDHRKIVELQARREYEGCGEYPSYIGWDTESLRRALDEARNMVGISVWIQTGGWTRFRRLTFLEPAGIWNEINAHACIRIFRDRMSAEESIADWCHNQWPSPTDPNRWVELLRRSDEAVKELLYLPDFARRKLYFRRVRVPQQLSVLWDHIFVNHAVRKLSRHFARDPAALVREGFRVLGEIRRMQEWAAELGLPADDLQFMEDSFTLLAKARAYALLPWSHELADDLKEAKRAYQAAYPRGTRQRYAVKIDFRRLRISRHRIGWFLNMLLRDQRRYRPVDRWVTLHLLSVLYPALTLLSRRKKEGFLESQAMGLDTVLR